MIEGSVSCQHLESAATDAWAFSFWRECAVLVVDDEPGMRNFLDRVLTPRCASVHSAASAEEGMALLERHHFDLVILDIALPGKNGVDWLVELRQAGFSGDVILITAFADMDTAIKALRAGAADFVLKPFRLDQILNAINRCLDRTRLARENFVLKREMSELLVDGLVGNAPAIRSLCAIVKQVAPLPSTVLIQGESGTGKEVVARALHRMSNRAQRAFVPVNCGAIPENLIDSELFGHVKGAFTGATQARDGMFLYAQGGTLFLDEVGELPMNIQSRLLRALEEHKVRPVGSEREISVDVRVIAATNRDLREEVKAGRFRHDLFYRLEVITLEIPPLCERPEDIPALVDHFTKQIATHLGVESLRVTHRDMERLRAYSWPGNVRELRNVIERSTILGYLAGSDLPDPDPAALPISDNRASTGTSLADVEKRHILHVLEAVSWNKSEAARRLQVSRKTLERKCAAWGFGARKEGALF
ncbi:MAG: sigma-54 dependent transcriptional regulator [Gammaproteobacteria bacterium]|jgi:DNA-binding NtrC family response regulator|nr:sigma-54 dependent transcriptional regulator [Gammaproteobacteria bacterium]